MEGLFAQKARSGTSKRGLTQRSPRGLRRRLGNAWEAVKGATRRAINYIRPAGHTARVRQGDKQRRSERKAASAARNARVRAATGNGLSLAATSLAVHGEQLRNRTAALGRSVSRSARSAFRSLFK